MRKRRYILGDVLFLVVTYSTGFILVLGGDGEVLKHQIRKINVGLKVSDWGI